MNRYIFLFLVLILSQQDIFPQTDDRTVLRFMFYNLENFFDTYDDPEKDDNEFLPRGDRRWNFTRYNSKKNSIYKVILAAGEWDPPALIGLCEVENRKILEDLIQSTNLVKYNYEILHVESGDPRGIDVAVIYRKDRAKLLLSYSLVPDGYDPDHFLTRPVLYSKWLISSDTLHLFINHWPSRRGGSLPGEALRIRLAETIRKACDSISRNDRGHAKILIAGDFNSTPADKEIQVLCKDTQENSNGSSLINIASGQAETGNGTYKYRGVWEMIDQVIVSRELIDSRSGLHISDEGLRIMNNDFLLTRDTGYPGYKPFSTYNGYRYQGGYSDHLPVLLDIYYR